MIDCGEATQKQKQNRSLMDTPHDYNESNLLSCHALLSSPYVAPPPSPLREDAQLVLEDGNERMRQLGKCSTLADELSSSLASIAREERCKVKYSTRGDAGFTRSELALARQQSRVESDGAGDVSEESWLSFLATQTAPTPPIVTATTSSSDDRYSSNGGRTSNDCSRTQTQQQGPSPLASDGHGLPRPIDDRVGTNHGNAHASVFASLPPPQLKRGGGGSSSSVQSSSSSEKSSSGDKDRFTIKHLAAVQDQRKRAATEMYKTEDIVMQKSSIKQKKRRTMRLGMSFDDEESSSSSGSDEGYDASSSDNCVQQSSYSSPSALSCEDGQFISRKHHARRNMRRSMSALSSVSSSSDLADFGSSSARLLSDSASASTSEEMAGARQSSPAVLTRQRKRSHDEASQGVAKIPSFGDSLAASNKIFLATNRLQQGGSLFIGGKRQGMNSSVLRHRLKSEWPSIESQAPIFNLGSDLMAHCMTFLEPTEVHSLLTGPLSKQWRDAYTVPQDVWRVLCLTEPFKAKIGPDDLESEGDADSSSESDSEMRNIFGKYRLLYTSFIRCLRYLTQIKDDAVHGRATPSVHDNGGTEPNAHQLTSNSGLRSFLAKARIAVGNKRQRSIAASASDSNSPVGLSDDDRSVESEPMVSSFGSC